MRYCRTAILFALAALSAMDRSRAAVSAQDSAETFPASWQPLETLPEPPATVTGVPQPTLTDAILGTEATDFDQPVDFTFREDLHAFPGAFGSDVRSVFRPKPIETMLIGGIFAAVSANNWDHHIRRNTRLHARRWGGLNNVLDVAGHPATHLGLTGAGYAVSLINDDPKLHDFTQTMLSALLITDLGSTGLKYAFDTTRPNGQSHGFPSGHAASAFAAAAVVEDQIGGWAGTGAFLFAGMVAWHRIDDRRHDLSDVIFGAALGSAVGKAVSRNRRLRDNNIRVSAYVDPDSRSRGFFVLRTF